uniref:Reverse transcriptase domain-containing protein n=1 Tax=Paramormyrops kingsleyae TaxID=1676925 RepID=A0A3B3TCC0_9TELE
MTADTGSPSLLILLDLTASFDTIDHNILLHRLQYSIGLSGNVHNWFTSYLTGRTEHVTLGSAKSHTHNVTCGVPQGSVLGPILFTIYMLPLGNIISRHGLSFHCYADDIQLYLRTTPITSTAPLSASTLTNCLEDIEVWMRLNFLKLNSSKTEAILVGTPHHLRSCTITSITFSGQNIPLSTSVTNLGVKMDPQLTFDTHIKHLCKSTFYHLKNIAKLRPTLSLADAEKLVHAFVSSRLDYCNALLIGIPGKNIQRLQYIQNSAARILMRVRKHDHITPILKTLHWLPVPLRIEYKVSLLTHQCIYG